MPQSFTAVVPVTNADAAANLAPQMPLGSETRLIAGTYSAIQKLLNMAAAVNLWWSGGTLGDPVNVGDATKTVTIWNPCTFESDVHSAIDVTASGNVAAGNNVNSGLDVISGRDMTAARDLSVARDANVTRNFGVTGNAAVAGTMAVAGVLTAAVGSLLVGAVTANNPANKIAGKHLDAAVLGGDADATYQLLSNDVVLIPDGSSILTADRTYTIGTTGATDGMSCTFSNQSTTHKITLMGVPAHPGGVELKVTSGIAYETTVILIGGVVYAIHDIVTS